MIGASSLLRSRFYPIGAKSDSHSHGKKEMREALKQRVTIQPGGVVHLQSSELIPGSEAEVIVILEAPSATPISMASLIGTAAGCYPTPEDADTFLRRERNAWED